MARTEKLAKLMNTLAERTANGGAKWWSGSHDDTFIWSTSSGSVVIFPTDHDGMQPWTVQILDATGQLLEEETFVAGETGADLARDLYRLARGSALDIDSTIDKLLGDLG